MTKPSRETIVLSAIASTVSGLIVALIMLSFTARYDKDGIVNKKLDEKVDKTEFVDKYKEINQRIDGKVDKEVFEMSQKNLDIFIKNQLEIQRDIKEMFKERKIADK